MAHAFQPRPAPKRQPMAWPRRHSRRWLKANDHAAVSALMAVIPSLPRPVLARITERLINRMDEIDGDPDVELNGDEADGGNAEDDFYPHSNWLGQPGCPVADPDCCLCQEDIGTDHKATAKMGFDANHAGEDAEENGDLEPRDPVRKPTYEIDQSRGPISPYQVVSSR